KVGRKRGEKNTHEAECLHNKSYAVEVAFPEGLTTTNHKEIKYEIDLSGKAEIITSSRSILSRIFAPIYELFKEK
ncbi:hypothetical protein LI173_20730, partial [Phocaeicola vulgatus]|nr:hypothetical protein [Phocaeicola vulgatus]